MNNDGNVHDGNVQGVRREALPYGYGPARKRELPGIVQSLFEYKWLILGITATLTILSAFYAHRLPDVFRSTAVLRVNQEEDKLVNIEDVSEMKVGSLNALKTIAETITHSSVLNRVVATNSLVTHPYFRGAADGPDSTDAVTRRLKRIVSSQLRRGTRLIEVSAVSTDARLSFLLANSTAAQFIRHSLDQNLNVNRSGNVVLMEEAKRLKLRLSESEKAVQEYKEFNNAVSLEDKQNITLEKLKNFNKEYSDAKSIRIQVAADLVQAGQMNNDTEGLLLLKTIRDDVTVKSLWGQIVEQKNLVASYKNRYLPKYPKMIQAQDQLKNLNESLHQAVIAASRSLQSSFDNALARETSLFDALKQAETEALELNRLSIQYNVLMREMESDLALYDSVLTRIKETDLTKGLEKTAVILVENASMPFGPYKPNRMLIVGASFFLSLFIGLGSAFGLSVLGSSIKTVDQAEDLLGFPVLGAIPEDKHSSERSHERLVVAESPNSTCTESYRSLRAAIQMLGREENRKVVLFTSALPSEGKTFTAINYAMTLAQQGYNTLLVDFDLRRPAVGKTFGKQSDQAGVTSYFVGEKRINELPVSDIMENFSIITAGPQVPNPGEQVANVEIVSRFIEDASKLYDRIVIDTAPINAVSDTMYLLDLVDVICLVIRSGRTPRKAIGRAVQVMERSGKSPSGIVLNFLPEHTGYGYYYYYSYNNYYGVKGVYGTEEEGGERRRRDSKTKKRS
jgi:polysaccharide biosynthesis transport protein